MIDDFMKVAILESKKAMKHNDVPVGAVIVQNNKIISKAHNRKEYYNNATKHAEIIAIEKACKKLKTWHLDDCELYVTLEPCMMCCGAIIQSRIKKIIYATPSKKFGYIESLDKIFEKNNNHKPNIIKYNEINETSEILINFFKNKRNKKI